MRFYFHPHAEQELDEAVEYYEQRRPGLGLEFAEEVYVTVARVAAFPDAGSPLSKNTRRCLVHRFPYGVIFQAKSAGIRVVAVASLHRRPGYWQDRV